MTNPGGLKFIRGECRFEQGATHLRGAGTRPRGLAKKIKAALLQQTELQVEGAGARRRPERRR